MRESVVQRLIMKALGGLPAVRLFRNNIGVGFVGKVASENAGSVTLVNYRRIRFGLFVGSSDLIGWKSVEITPDMVGTRVAVFLSVETKAPTGQTSTEQETWIERVRFFGGIAGRARSVADAIKLIGRL
jgi:hypothetical protein